MRSQRQALAPKKCQNVPFTKTEGLRCRSAPPFAHRGWAGPMAGLQYQRLPATRPVSRQFHMNYTKPAHPTASIRR